jgi:hypothetical protein
MDMATLINALNQNFNQVQLQDRRKVITDEDGNVRIILGKQDDGTYAINVSGDGDDVRTASQDELVMSSNWKMWKIVNSGSGTLSWNSIRRSGTLTLNSTNIGYTSDIFIWIPGLAEILADVQGFSGKIQMFVRDDSTKEEIKDSGTYFHDGTNWAVYNHTYFAHRSGYLVIRTTIRWMAGTVTLTPRTEALPAGSIYWEIANPTRFVPGGQGGGGSPAGKFVYYDSVIYNGSTQNFEGYDDSFVLTTVLPGAFSAIRSYTYQFDTNADSYLYPKDRKLFPYPPLAIA